MKIPSKVYCIIFLILPFLCIFIMCYLVLSVDKKLIYKEVTIEYVTRTSGLRSQEIGIDYYASSPGAAVSFYTKEYPERLFFVRYYGALKFLVTRNYYTHLMDKKLKTVGLYVDPYYLERPLREKSDAFIQFGDTKNRVPFFYIDQGKNKSIYYYLDIFCYVLISYGVMIMLSYGVLLFVSGRIAVFDGGLTGIPLYIAVIGHLIIMLFEVIF